MGAVKDGYDDIPSPDYDYGEGPVVDHPVKIGSGYFSSVAPPPRDPNAPPLPGLLPSYLAENVVTFVKELKTACPGAYAYRYSGRSDRHVFIHVQRYVLLE